MKVPRWRDGHLARSRHAACARVVIEAQQQAGKPRAVAAPGRSGGCRAGHRSACRRQKTKHGASRSIGMQARTGIEPAPAWQVLRGELLRNST